MVKTHTSLDSYWHERQREEKKKKRRGLEETERREKLPVAVAEIKDGKPKIFSQQSKKKKKNYTFTQNLQTRDLREGKTGSLSNFFCSLSRALTFFSTPHPLFSFPLRSSLAHLLFGVVHFAIEQRSFVQPRQRLRQILIRTGS